VEGSSDLGECTTRISHSDDHDPRPHRHGLLDHHRSGVKSMNKLVAIHGRPTHRHEDRTRSHLSRVAGDVVHVAMRNARHVQCRDVPKQVGQQHL
jgi:hypothetical protein